MRGAILTGEQNALIMKSDGGRSIIALKNSLAKFHGGTITTEALAKGVSQSNGAVEEAGKTIREHALVMKEQVEDEAQVVLHPEDPIIQWMIRWFAMTTF